MTIQLSFGNKIPVSQHRVYNNQTDKFENATVYEFDGTDSSDYDYMVSKFGAWSYKYLYEIGLFGKIDNVKRKDDDIRARMMADYNKFYIIESTDGNLLGLLQTQEIKKNKYDIKFLESNHDEKYKYAGQNILASIASKLKDLDEAELMVTDPETTENYSAVPFYQNVCGFMPKGARTLYLDKNAMNEFVQNVEKRTKAPIIDLQG